MTFIPDGAGRRLRDLSPNAGIVYVAHCEFRIHKFRVSFATEQEIAEAYAMPLGSVRNALTELKKKKWIRIGSHYVELLVGDFSPVDRRHPRKPIPALPLLAKRGRWAVAEGADAPPAIPETVNQIHETVNEIPETVNQIPETGKGANKGSRARDPSDASDPSTHTPSQTPRLFREPEATGPRRVCVSRHRVEVRKAYADDPANVDRHGDKLGGGWLKTSGDGSSDELIDLWLAGREAARERAERERRLKSAGLDVALCPDCFGTGRRYVEQEGRQVSGPRCDHARLFERLDGESGAAVA